MSRERRLEMTPPGEPGRTDVSDRLDTGSSEKNAGRVKRKGRLTFRLTAILFLLGALSEIASPGAEVPLFGAFRTGAAAVGYHLAYFSLYTALAVGLWQGRRWGYALVFAGVGLVTADTAQMLAHTGVIVAWLEGLLERFGAGAAFDRKLLATAIQAVSLSIAAGWWGFGAYTYFRRDYFHSSTSTIPSRTAKRTRSMEL